MIYMENVEIKFKKTHNDAVLPTKNYNEDTCWDITAIEDTLIPARGSAVVPTGLKVAYITPGYSFVVCPRSGLGFKHGINVHPGEIDNPYRGDLGIKLYNFSDTDYIVKKFDRCAQFKVQRVINTQISWGEIELTERGEKGFGSSGK